MALLFCPVALFLWDPLEFLLCEMSSRMIWNLFIMFSLIAYVSLWISATCPRCVGSWNVAGTILSLMQSCHDRVMS